MTYHYSPEGKLSQGDIFHRVKVITNIIGGANNSPKYGERNIIIITRNCEIDKAPDSVLVAKLVRVSSQFRTYAGPHKRERRAGIGKCFLSSV